jgi:nucleoid DNA-binding protein
MKAGVHNIRTAREELTKVRSELLALEQRFQTVQTTLREAIEALPLEEQLPAYPSRGAPMPPLRSKGQPLKVSAELAAKVQRALRLETKKEAEIAVGAVIAALEETLLNNLGTEGFSLKLGGFGKFKVRHLKPVEKRVGFSGKTVMTKGRRKVKFVPLGMLRANETFG